MKQIVELIPTLIHRNRSAPGALVLLNEDRSRWEIALTLNPDNRLETFTPKPTTTEEDERLLDELAYFFDAAPQGRIVHLRFSKTQAIIDIC